MTKITKKKSQAKPAPKGATDGRSTKKQPRKGPAAPSTKRKPATAGRPSRVDENLSLAPSPVSRTEILATQKLTDEKWLNLFARTVRRDGQDHRWLFASRKPEPQLATSGGVRPDAVLIVPILLGGPEPLLVATREWRVPIGGYEWGVPAGLVDGDESVEEAARRELWEETGFELVEVTEVSPINYSSTGMTDESVQMVYCTCRKPKRHRQHLDGAEEIEVRLLSIADIGKLIHCDEPVNGRAWMSFYMYHRLGKLE